LDAEKCYAEISAWFESYVRPFKKGDAAARHNILLKEEHIFRVVEETATLGREIGLGLQELALAKTIALLHDIGRFEQYALYNTFADGRSVNHAELGVAILGRTGILSGCAASRQDLILRAILYHNRAVLPSEESDECLFYTRLLRDADKLDIWRVVTDYYHRADCTRNPAIELDLPDTPGVSAPVFEAMMQKKIVETRHMRNLNDFKLLQMGWIFDINFPPTFRHVRERRYLEKIRASLPDCAEIEEIYACVQNHLAGRLLLAPTG